MKLNNTFIIVIIAAIGLYAIFLMFSDLSEVFGKLKDLKIEFLPIILLLGSSGWMILFIRWNLLLKHSNVNLPVKENLKIYLAGFALAVTPGKLGEFLKSQLLKTKFGIPRKITAPIILVERLYNFIGIVIISIMGIWYFKLISYVIIATIMLLAISFTLISSKQIFQKFLVWLSKIKFMSKFALSLSESYDVVRKSTRGLIFIYATSLSVGFWFIESLIAYFVLLSFGINGLKFLNVIPTYTSSIILGAASFLPEGIGIVEGSLAGLLALQGVDISVALALVVLIRIFTLWYNVLVGFIALKMVLGFSSNSFVSEKID